MHIYAKRGDKVRFAHPNAGYTLHQQTAKEHLKVGDTYTVERTEAGDWHTDVRLQEVPGVAFNSVLFDDEPPQQQPPPRQEQGLSPLAQAYSTIAAWGSDLANKELGAAASTAVDVLMWVDFEKEAAALAELLHHTEQKARADERERVVRMLDETQGEIKAKQGSRQDLSYAILDMAFFLLRQRLGGGMRDV